MAAIVTRETAGAGATVKNAPLTNAEVDNNFININSELATKATYPTITGNNGKYLSTDGVDVNWADITLPSGQTAGSTIAGYLQYNGTTKTSGQLDSGATDPTNATRLNYDGHFYATRFYGDGSQLTGIATGINVQVISANTTAVKDITYVLISALTLTLPASPTSGDMINVCNRSGTASCVLARNGSNIMSLAEDLTIDVLNASFTLFYADATRGWTIL